MNGMSPTGINPTITRNDSSLTILEVIAQLTTSCSIRLKCIRMGFTLSRSIEIETFGVLRRLTPGRSVPPVIT